MTLDPQRRLKPVGWRYRTTTAALLLAAPFGVVSLAPGDPVSNLRGLAVAWTVFALSAPVAVVACFVAWVYGSYVRRASEPVGGYSSSARLPSDLRPPPGGPA